MVADEDDNNVDGNGATGNEADDDGDSATGNDDVSQIYVPYKYVLWARPA